MTTINQLNSGFYQIAVADVNGNITGVNLTGTTTLGNVSNVKIGGGSNAQFLQTDGNGNLQWTTVSTSSIANGNSNVVVEANSNVTVSVEGNSNVVTVTGTGMNVAGTMNSSDALTVQANGASITGNVNINGNLNIVGNISAANVVNLIVDAPLILLANANPGDVLDIGIVGEYNDGAQKYSGIARNHNTGDWQVYSNLASRPNTTVDFANAALGNIVAGELDAESLTVAGESQLGNVSNVKIGGGTNTQFLQTDGNGNLQWVTISSSSIANGNSNVNIPSANGNVIISVRGNANVLTVTGTGANVTGTFNATGNVLANNLLSLNQITANGNINTNGSLFATNQISATGNITGNNIFTGGGVAATGNVSGNNLTAINTVSANGNITGGNISTAGLITATGNVTGGNLISRADIVGLNSLFVGNLADVAATKLRMVNIGASSYIQSGNGIGASAGNIIFSPYLDTAQRVAINTATGNLTAGNLLTTGIIAATGNIATSGRFIGNGSGLTGVTAIVTGSWNVFVGTSIQSFTVDPGNTYFMWVDCNIPNGILAWHASVTISNTNVPVVGAQYAWVYNGGGTPIDFTSIPNQFVGTANTIVRSSTSPSATTNKFEFGFRNTTGNFVTVRYGWIKMS